ncbi:MAG: phosphohistidine phosphatase SixA [Acidobacteria bacterium]|nr:phosphohistidine phosphatase SixA [Acidobacteriota bacterium]
MRLYLIRHGKAGSASPSGRDADRGLTGHGREQCRRLAHTFRALEIHCKTVFTSPLRRARASAEILVASGVAPFLEELDELAPGGPLDSLLTHVTQWRDDRFGDIALVGHVPDLVTCAERLVWGEGRGRLHLPTAGVISIELSTDGRIIGGSLLFWLTSPTLLP